MAITSMRPVHPGEVLREEFLEPLGMPQPHWLALCMCRRRPSMTSCGSVVALPPIRLFG